LSQTEELIPVGSVSPLVLGFFVEYFEIATDISNFQQNCTFFKIVFGNKDDLKKYQHLLNHEIILMP